MIPTSRIVDNFNDAINHLGKAVATSKEGDIPKAQRELVDCSIKIYSSLEWSMKNYLSAIFNDSILHDREIKIIEGSGFFPKFSLFQSNVSPSFEESDINPDPVLTLRQSVRNNPEHSGFIPYYNSIIEVLEEVKKIISCYIDSTATFSDLPSIEQSDIPEDNNWSRFYKACESFNNNINYILLTNSNTDYDPEKYKYLGLLDWSLIIDFNPNTETEGFYKNASPEISKRKKIHLNTLNDFISFSQYNTCYWLAANGLLGREDTITNNYRNWSRKYSNFLDDYFQKFFSTIGDAPTVVVIMWDEKDYVRKLCELIDIQAGEKCKYIFASDSSVKIENVINTYNGSFIQTSIPQIADGVLRIRNFLTDSDFDEQYILPARDETFVTLSREHYLWIEEDFHVVHRNIIDKSLVNFDEKAEMLKFFKGGEISWEGLQLNHDIARDKTTSIKRMFEKFLRERKTKIIDFNHYPGIGGTTLCKKIAWQLRDEHPVLIMKKYRHGDSIEKIYKIFEATRKSILIIIESAEINIDDAHRLFDELLSRNIPCLCVVIKRSKFNHNDEIYVDGVLSDLEFASFISRYKELKPEKQSRLERALKSNEVKERHPFYLGLITFEKEFEGLESYIKKSLEEATDTQKKIISIISFCHYFAQKSISAQMFTSLLSLPESSMVNFEKHLNDNLLSLLVNDKKLFWRPIHYLVSEEILKTVLTSTGSNRDNWKTHLLGLAIIIIDLIANSTSTPTENDIDLLQRIFVLRDNQELLGKEEETNFSNFVGSGLQTDEQRLEVFLHLTNSFPNEPHYWAHLSRLYSIKIGDHEKALEAITNAINFSNGTDALLFHMKGMCLRKKSYDDMSSMLELDKIPENNLIRLKEIIEESGRNFEISRVKNPLNEYGYISHIQLIIHTIDFYFKISSYDDKTNFMRNLDPWLHSKLDLAEEMLSKVKFQTQMKGNNSFVDSCNISIQNLYGDYARVIEGWNNLLTKNYGNKPSIRRSIIWAYVRRSSNWENLQNKEIVKILSLIEDNIQEEPDNSKNIILWFNAARRSESITINSAIVKISTWRTLSETDDSIYYLGILNTILAIEGASTAKINAENLIKELSEKKRNAPFRKHCYEYLGKGVGLTKLIKRKIAISYSEENEITYNTEILQKVKGKISFIKGPEAGNIELTCGLSAFFIPARGEGFAKDRDINKNVEFYLGFSYDGLRAFEVESI